MAALPGNQAPPGGKHVASMAPGGPRDFSAALARHREGDDARLTETATTPDPQHGPAVKSRENGEILPSPVTGSAWSTGNTWHPRAPGEYAGY